MPQGRVQLVKSTVKTMYLDPVLQDENRALVSKKGLKQDPGKPCSRDHRW